MSRLAKVRINSSRRSTRTRAKLNAGQELPRLSVFVSNYHVSAQIIDDSTAKTLVSATTVGQKAGGTMTEKAAWVGAEVAKKAKSAKIKQVAFDRGAKKYHGRVKALAEAARENGLEF